MRWHSAFTFDDKAFHTELMARFANDGTFDFTAFRQEAIAMVQNAPDELIQTFDELRYNEQLSDDPDEHGGDIFYSSEAYITHVLAALVPSPSLSNNRYRLSYYVLEMILPLTGWYKDEVFSLIYGKPFDTLFDTEDHEIFAKRMRYGRVLNCADSSALLEHLKVTAQTFHPLKVHEMIRRNRAYHLLDWMPYLADAYQDGIEMFETALQRNATLFVLVSD